MPPPAESRPAAGSAPAAGRAATSAAAEGRRNALVVVLTLTTGALDAATYLRLGHVFSSVITGNLALLGIAVGQHRASPALDGGLALAGYAVGVLAGGALAGMPQRGQPAWPARVTATLTVELAVLAAFTAGWLAAGGHPAGPSRLALLMLAAVAMGTQSAAVRRLGPISTTYLTSTLTGFLGALAIRRWPAQWKRSAGVLLMLVLGATMGGLAVVFAPGWVPATVLAPLALVVASALRRSTR